MAVGSVARGSRGIARGSRGTVTGDGTALSVTLGWRPKYILIWNQTDAIRWEKIDGQVDAQSIKTVTAGTTTADATSAIVISDTGFLTSAALNANGKALFWYAE